MKKNIVLTGILATAIGLMAFGLINFDQVEGTETLVATCQPNEGVEKVYSDFSYDLGPRFEPIKKKDVLNATSLSDFLTEKEIRTITHLKSVNLIVIKDERQSDIRETGHNQAFNDAQLALLSSFDYSSHFTVRAEFQKKNGDSAELEDSFFGPHFTVVPEQQAKLIEGRHVLVEYLRHHNKENTVNLDPKKMRPAMMSFMVTKDGNVENIQLERPSGHEEMDKHMVDLLSKAPGTWKPAQNAAGEKIDQELVVSFGIPGC